MPLYYKACREIDIFLVNYVSRMAIGQTVYKDLLCFFKKYILSREQFFLVKKWYLVVFLLISVLRYV